MGSANASKSTNKGTSWASGGSENESRNWSNAIGSSLSAAQSKSDVWGAQQPALSSLYDAALNFAQARTPAGQSAQQVAGQAQNAWMQQLTPGGNPYFERSVQGAIDQATQGFTQQVLPELDARGVQVGQYGQARDSLARGQAAGIFGQGLANTVSGMYANQYQGDQNRALSALGQAQQVQNLQSAPLTTAAGIIGGPTVLQDSQSLAQAQNQSQSWGQSIGNAWNNASSNTSGKGASGGVGVGGK